MGQINNSCIRSVGVVKLLLTLLLCYSYTFATSEIVIHNAHNNEVVEQVIRQVDDITIDNDVVDIQLVQVEGGEIKVRNLIYLNYVI